MLNTKNHILLPVDKLTFRFHCYTAERSYRRGFYLFYLLGLERDKLSTVNQELECVVEVRSVELVKLEKH